MVSCRHFEGSRLTHDQTCYIFETNTIGIEGESVKVDDIIETVNHFSSGTPKEGISK